jgi:hypothetical protein
MHAIFRKIQVSHRAMAELSPLDEAVLAAEVEAICEEMHFNPDQSTVCRNVARWFSQSGATAPPVITVHGAFGAGKTLLLVAVVKLYAYVSFDCCSAVHVVNLLRNLTVLPICVSFATLQALPTAGLRQRHKHSHIDCLQHQHRCGSRARGTTRAKLFRLLPSW